MQTIILIDIIADLQPPMIIITTRPSRRWAYELSIFCSMFPFSQKQTQFRCLRSFLQYQCKNVQVQLLFRDCVLYLFLLCLGFQIRGIMQDESPFLDFMENFPITITCPICEEEYNETERRPLLLCDGQHSMCEHCLSKILNYVEEDDEILCPFCKEPLSARVKNFRLMEEVVSAVHGLQTYNEEVRFIFEEMMKGSRRMERELQQEKKINFDRSLLVKSLYIEIEKREQERSLVYLEENPPKMAKNSKNHLKTSNINTKRKSEKGRDKKNLSYTKSKSKSKISQPSVSFVKNNEKVATMKSINYRREGEEQEIEQMLSQFDPCFSEEDELPLQPITATQRKTCRNRNKKPLPYLISNPSSINPEELKRISRGQSTNQQHRQNDNRKLYVDYLLKYDFYQMKELNLSKLNLIESHLQPLGSMRDHTFPSLLKLNLSHNRLSMIPAFVFRLKTLHSLNMSNNSLTRVSDHLAELVNLEVLDLWRNNLNVVPFIVYKLKRIRKVDLSNNKIVSVQPWMLDGPIKIDLFGNPLVLTEVMNEKTKKKPEFLNGFIKKLNRSMI